MTDINPAKSTQESISSPSIPSKGELDSEKTRNEIEKLKIEVQELKAWRWKVLLTTLTPIGSVALFLFGWHGTHLKERRQQNQELYTRAAAELASHDASVRLGGVKAVDTYIALSTPDWLSAISQTVFDSSDSRVLEEEQKEESMALIVGSLSRENDPAVLEGISDEIAKHAEESIDPLISENKAAAVQFARAAGYYSGLSVLRLKHARFYSEDNWILQTDHRKTDSTIYDIEIITLRTGSPFEGTDTYNQRFEAREILTQATCPFKELFDNEQILAMESDLSDNTRVRPPTPKEIDVALSRVIDTAAVLERSSYILGAVVRQNWSAIQQWRSSQHKDLYGTAVIVGQPGDAAVSNLRSLGGYFNSPDDNTHNPGCRISTNERRTN